VVDVQLIVFKINAAPFQTDGFAAPQPIVKSKQDWKVAEVVFGALQYLFSLHSASKTKDETCSASACPLCPAGCAGCNPS